MTAVTTLPQADLPLFQQHFYKHFLKTQDIVYKYSFITIVMNDKDVNFVFNFFSFNENNIANLTGFELSVFGKILYESIKRTLDSFQSQEKKVGQILGFIFERKLALDNLKVNQTIPAFLPQ